MPRHRVNHPRGVMPITGLALALLAMGSAVQAEDEWDPPALRVRLDDAALRRTPPDVPRLVAHGRSLFLTVFNRLDGAGRPAATGDAKPTRRLLAGADSDRLAGPDASACAGCHQRPGLGGRGDYATSAFVPSATRYAVATPDHGNAQTLRRPPSLFGAGLLELLAREMTAELRRQRDEALARAKASGQETPAVLAAKGVPFGSLIARPDGSYDAAGVTGVDPDLVIRPFGWHGDAVSIREISITALNQHHGIQAQERFGRERTGLGDFDEDGVEVEFTPAEVTALALFVASLPPPLPQRPESALIRQGRAAFERAGCPECHRPALPLDGPVFEEPGAYNPPGTMRPAELGTALRLPLARAPRAGPVAVAAFTDLKRHVICDEEDPFFCNEVSTRGGTRRGEFLTAELWGSGQGAPYGHHGECGTLSEAIRHHAGEAAPARRAFLALPDDAKRALIAFLLTLGAPAPGEDGR